MSIEALARPEIVAMKPYSSARSEAPGQGVLLNANEAPRSLLADATGATDWERLLNRYPDPQPARLVERLAQRYGMRPDQLLVTRGSDEGIDLLTRVFCRAGQDAILHCPPTFGMYRIAAQSQGAAIVSVERHADDGYRLDGERLLAVFGDDPRIKLVFLTSPNNPTGDSVAPELLERLLETARGRAVVVMDEAYAEFCERPSFASWVNEHDNFAVLRTLSKAWASAGLRCGAVIAQPELLALLRRVIAPYPLPSPVVGLALRMLEDDLQARQQRLLEEIRDNKQALLAALEGRAFLRRMLPGEANFVLAEVDDAAALLAHCARRGVVLRGFPSDPALRDCLRVSVGTAEEIARLSAVLDEWESMMEKSA
jgi:histidinol-phosphate aminotransferase